jgi:Reverse transcriptase (RNA-dependent DNA polymerase).
LFEKLFLKGLKPVLDEKQIIAAHQFGFRNNHSTIDQVHILTTIIEKTPEEIKVCSTIFLDVAQTFDKIWQEGLSQS